MRVLEGRTLQGRSRRSFLGNLGQTAFPVLSPEREAVRADAFPYEYWGRLAAKGEQIVRIGQTVSNTQYHAFLPTDDLYVILVGWAGTDAGKVMYAPVSTFLAEYGVLTERGETIVLSQAVRPAIVTDRTFENFYKDAEGAWGLAQNALLNAKLGDAATATTRLDAKGAGARALRDAASVTLRVLEDIGFFTRDEGMNLRKEVLQPLSDTINEATQAIGRSQSFILGLIDKVSELWKLTAVQLRGFAVKKWNGVLEIYKSFYDALASLDVAIQKTEADIVLDSAGTERLVIFLDGLKKDRAELAFRLGKVEQMIVSAGIPLSDFRKEAGLGEGISVGMAITGAFIAGIGFGLWQLVEGTVNQLTMTFHSPRPGYEPTYIPDPGLTGLITRIFLSEQEMAHRTALTGQGPQAERYVQAAREAKEALGYSAGHWWNFGKKAGEAFPNSVDPNAVENIREAARRMNVTITKTNPWPYLGALAAGLVLSVMARFFASRTE